MSCPICGRPTLETYRPFCSKRCSEVDLGRWITGAYAIPADDDDDRLGEDPTDNEDQSRPH